MIEATARNRKAREQALAAFARARQDFDELTQIVKREFEAAASLSAYGFVPAERLASSNRIINTAINQLPIAMNKYESPIDDGFCSRIMALDAKPGFAGTPTLSTKAVVYLGTSSGAALAIADTGTEYAQHALIRFLERTDCDAVDFLSDLTEAEFLSEAIAMAAQRRGSDQPVICPMGGGALLGVVQPYPWKNPVVGAYESAQFGVRKRAKIKITASPLNPHAHHPSRVAWKTFIGPDEIRRDQIAILEAIENIIQPIRKTLKILFAYRLTCGAPPADGDMAYLKETRHAAIERLHELKRLLDTRDWLPPEQRQLAAA